MATCFSVAAKQPTRSATRPVPAKVSASPLQERADASKIISRLSAIQARANSAPAGNAVIQRYKIKYGKLQNDCGTDMHVTIFGKSDPDLGSGSSPKTVPNWWPASGPARDWLGKYAVQGHLLNEKLGGPGDTMKNLTPITKSTNSTHFKKVEDAVKADVLTNDRTVEYHVYPRYSGKTKAADFGTGVPAGVATLLPNFADELICDYTSWDKSGKVVGGLPGELEIKNEGSHKKGNF